MISVFKDFVMNLSLYGLVGVGTIAIGDTMAPALNLGIGQKFYFGKRWGFRVDLGLLAYEGVNYFRASDGGASPLADTIEPGTVHCSGGTTNASDVQRINLTLLRAHSHAVDVGAARSSHGTRHTAVAHRTASNLTSGVAGAANIFQYRNGKARGPPPILWPNE